ncbi:MAG: hypothetical protein KDK96_11815 [Chlamydiia bacterium]|nr:hypothetical protein [Chlamydiia bacterium]MCP5491235.1 hypothetical protein [Chlamydiales bacterium]
MIPCVAAAITTALLYWGVYEGLEAIGDKINQDNTYSPTQDYQDYLMQSSKEEIEKDKKKTKEPPYNGKELGNDPTKPPAEGFEWKGKDPTGGRKGAWYNKETGESLHPDLDHPPPKKPHWDYEGPAGDKARINIDGTYEWK